jgi:hypothetical protein
MRPETMGRLLGVVHSGQFFQHRTLVAIEELIALVVANAEIKLTAPDLAGVNEVALRLLLDFGWVSQKSPDGTMYQATDAGREAYAGIANRRSHNERAFRANMQALVAELRREGHSPPPLEPEVLVNVLTAAAVAKESGSYADILGGETPHGERSLEALRAVHGDAAVRWAKDCYSLLPHLKDGSRAYRLGLKLHLYADYVAIVRSLVDWHSCFPDLRGKVVILIDPSCLVALVAEGDVWHPLVRSVFDRIAASGTQRANSESIEVSLLVPMCSLREFCEAAERAWEDFETLPVRGGGLGVLPEEVRRLGLIDYYRRRGVGIGEAAIRRLEDDLQLCLEGVGARLLTGVEVEQAKIRDGMVRANDTRMASTLGRPQLKVRVELHELAESIQDTLGSNGYVFIATASTIFARLEQALIRQQGRPHVIPGLMMFCLAEALGLTADTVADMERFAYDYVRGQKTGLRAWLDIREYWNSVRQQPEHLDLSSQLDHLWAGDAEVITLLRRYFSHVLGLADEDFEEEESDNAG